MFLMPSAISLSGLASGAGSGCDLFLPNMSSLCHVFNIRQLPARRTSLDANHAANRITTASSGPCRRRNSPDSERPGSSNLGV